MKTAKLNAICVVKDEDDIIAQTLTHATGYCDTIYILDNGSTDQTWPIVQSLNKKYNQIVPYAQTSEPWRDGLRSLVYNDVHHRLSDQDWWLILDSDEFLAEDPRPLIDGAAYKNADIINAWQIQFYYTEIDYQAHLEGKDSRSLPVFGRRRYYLINWQEPRIFRNQTDKSWDPQIEEKTPNGLRNIYRRRILNRHYQFRDPEQIQKRLNVRIGSSYFRGHVKSSSWQDVMRPSRKLNFYNDGDPWRFSPSGLIYYYRRRLLFEVRSKSAAALRRMRGVCSSLP